MRLKILKDFGFKSALAMLTFSAMALFFQAPSHAQVNKKLLTDVIKSCHKDMNNDYFESMGIKTRENISKEFDFYLRKECIRSRYRHSALIEKMPWLLSSGEIVQGYSASVAIHIILVLGRDSIGSGPGIESLSDKVLSCFVSQDPSSDSCRNSLYVLRDQTNYRGQGIWNIDVLLPDICPKCVIAHDDNASVEITRGTIKWFLSLDKTKRREIISLLSSREILVKDLKEQENNAVKLYEGALDKIEQEGKERRRRDLLGQ